MRRKNYFNSRPHEEVDKPAAGRDLDAVISTHDLTKRSTWTRFRFFCNRSLISTHDLTKRSTHAAGAISREYLFQLTTSRRGRLPFPGLIFLRRYFNSRPHEEVDPVGVARLNGKYIFQLTTSRRGRPSSRVFRLLLCIFQLTTSRRGRHV